MKTPAKLEIAVVGAGLGGLTAAACLLDAGHSVRVFERSKRLGEIGAGIQISANAMRVLASIGLRDEVSADAVAPEGFRFRVHNTAELLHEIPLGEFHAQQYGEKYLHVHRADLHRALQAAVERRVSGAVQLDAAAQGFSEHTDHVTLHLADGSRHDCDLLVGADGIKSVIRQQIVGDAPIEFTGYAAWRATVPAESLGDHYMDRVCTLWVGPGAHAVIYYVRGGTVLNFVGIVETDKWLDESWTIKDSWTNLKQDFRGWHEDVQRLIDSLPRDGCFRWALYSRAPLPTWHTRRVTILGDAAHSTLPFMAQGAAMAIEDGAVLARAVSLGKSVPAALAAYEHARLDRTARIQTGSRQMADLYHSGHDPSGLRERFVRQDLNSEFGRWLYGYDALSAPLASQS